ncbi:MAG: hypothetical protein HZA89_00945 [Verrucomicrobia bacterium]|nr:hypothetical protein [Verrucomicrobiota bacterium]
MVFFKKKADPISEHARELNARIAALEAEIRQLDSQAETATVVRSRFTVPQTAPRLAPSQPAPIFEEAVSGHGPPPGEPEITPSHFNELGVRKFDLLAVWRRFKNHFYGPPVSNPKLVRYLASGGVQGLRPLRYEKRVARNRTLFLLGVLILVFYGLFAFLFRNN